MVRVLAPAQVVECPPATAPPHGLRTAARQIFEPDNRWEAGLTFDPETCLSVRTWDPACGTDGSDAGDFEDADDPPDLLVVRPFQIYVPVTCNSQGYSVRDLEGRATRGLDAGTSKGMEQVFWSGLAGTANYSLVGSTPNVQGNAWDGTAGVLNASATTAPVAVSPSTALSLLSQSLGACGLGGRGMIHASPFLVEQWGGNGHIGKDGDRLITKGREDIIVAGSGYSGNGPTGNPAATGTASARWAFATGMVEYRLGEIDLVSDKIAEVLDRKQDTVTWIAERMVAITTDACCTFAVLVSV